MSVKLIPQKGIAEDSLNLHVKNVLSALAEAIKEEAIQTALDWAEEADTDANVFMQDRAAETLLSTLIGYLTAAQPRAHQLTSTHIDAYFHVKAQPLPPTNLEGIGED